MADRSTRLVRAVAVAFALAVFVWFAIILNAIGVGLFGWLAVVPAFFAYKQAHDRLGRSRAPGASDGGDRKPE